VSITARILVDREFVLGENPLWDERRSLLLWTNIEAGELWRWDSDGGSAERFYEGPRVGGFTIQDDGRLLLFRERDVALMDDDGRVESIVAFEDPQSERFNDVFGAPDGSVFAGTVGRTDTSGGLFHLSRDGVFRCLLRDSKYPNGMAIATDRRTLFYTCSTSGTISRFELDPDTASISNRTIIHRSGEGQGIPDGLTMDTDENLWSARWGASKVLKLTKGGEVLDEIAVPTRHVTSVAFGGPDRRSLFITTAGGAVYACEPGVAGIPEFSSRIAPACRP
jgi:D-xylonolactonase